MTQEEKFNHMQLTQHERSCTHASICLDLKIQDAFSASSVTNRLTHQTLSLVTQTWYIRYVLFQLLLLVQLRRSIPPAGAYPKLFRRQASLKPICTSYSKKSCQGLQPGSQDFTLWADRQLSH